MMGSDVMSAFPLVARTEPRAALLVLRVAAVRPRDLAKWARWLAISSGFGLIGSETLLTVHQSFQLFQCWL